MSRLDFDATLQIAELSHVPYKTGIMFAKVITVIMSYRLWMHAVNALHARARGGRVFDCVRLVLLSWV